MYEHRPIVDEASNQLETQLGKELPDLEKQKTETIVKVLRDLKDKYKVLEEEIIKMQKEKGK